MSVPQHLEPEYEKEEPRVGYEQVEGEWYPFCGPAGDPTTPVPCEEVDGEWYPFTEEGAPVVQGIRHHKTVGPLENMVTGLLLDWPDVGIYSDVFVFWKRPQKKPQGPDLMVLPCVRKHRKPRESVYLWREPSWPVFVLEVLSDRNDAKDQAETFRIYQDELKVPEYLINEPRTTPKSVWGYRLTHGRYVPIPPDEKGRIWSEQLKGWFGINDAGEVQVWNEADEPMPRHDEALLQLRDERRRAEQAERRAEQERRRAEQERRRAEQERRRAEQEGRRAEKAERRAEQEGQEREEEARRREAAEARVRELEAELRRLRGEE